MNVYEAINSVQAALAKTGISKDRTNTQGAGYKFRGIDDVYNALAPLLATNGLCILPRVLSRECAERQSKAGGALFYVTLHVEFDLVSTDGSKHVVSTFGEAMDSGDKATNKAMSAAYKYMAMQVFAIPTEGDGDADSHTHEVVAEKPKDDWMDEPEEAKFLKTCLNTIVDLLAEQPTGEKSAAFFYGIGNQDEQMAVWSKLGAQQRRIIKLHKQDGK